MNRKRLTQTEEKKSHDICCMSIEQELVVDKLRCRWMNESRRKEIQISLRFTWTHRAHQHYWSRRRFQLNRLIGQMTEHNRCRIVIRRKFNELHSMPSGLFSEWSETGEAIVFDFRSAYHNNTSFRPLQSILNINHFMNNLNKKIKKNQKQIRSSRRKTNKCWANSFAHRLKQWTKNIFVPNDSLAHNGDATRVRTHCWRKRGVFYDTNSILIRFRCGRIQMWENSRHFRAGKKIGHKRCLSIERRWTNTKSFVSVKWIMNVLIKKNYRFDCIFLFLQSCSPPKRRRKTLTANGDSHMRWRHTIERWKTNYVQRLLFDDTKERITLHLRLDSRFGIYFNLLSLYRSFFSEDTLSLFNV